MIRRIPPAFAGMSEFYVDEAGAPLVNNRGHLATDRDVSTPEIERDLDRLTLEMCTAQRAQGNVIPEWLLKAELQAFKRARARAAA